MEKPNVIDFITFCLGTCLLVAVFALGMAFLKYVSADIENGKEILKRAQTCPQMYHMPQKQQTTPQSKWRQM